MSQDRATRRLRRIRSVVERTILPVVLVVALGGCGVLLEQRPSSAQVVLLERRDLIAELPEFTEAPAGARLVKEQRATGCEDADGAADTPSAYRLYKIAPTRLQQSVQELRSRWEKAGWTHTDSTDGSGEYGKFHHYGKNLGDGWPAELSVYIASASLIEVTGRLHADTACG